jgi:heptosyltransferase II
VVFNWSLTGLLTTAQDNLKVSTAMLDNPLQKFLFHLTSLLTTWFPRGGAWFFNTFIPPIGGNKLLINHINRKNLRIVQSVKKFERILVIPDIHIGDAILAQGGLKVFKDFFPNARVDFIVKKAVASLFEGNPNVSNLYPVFNGVVFPSETDLENVKRISAENNYDLCYNCSPFFESESLFPKGQKILNYVTIAPQIIRNDMDQANNSHIAFTCYDFAYRYLSTSHKIQRTDKYTGVPLTLSDQAIQDARTFLKDHGVSEKKPILFLNPDTASIYTRIPHHDQIAILKKLASLDCSILLGVGYTAQNIETELLDKMTPGEKAKITIVPKTVSLDAYGALIDFCDVFISGDTGPLHIAAARKVSKSGEFRFRNKTFVISIFGATPPRLSGYDSTNPLYFGANQDVLSKTYVSESPCRNITCVNKMAKTCKNVRCYEFLNTDVITSDIQAYLSGLAFSSN